MKAPSGTIIHATPGIMRNSDTTAQTSCTMRPAVLGIIVVIALAMTAESELILVIHSPVCTFTTSG